MSLLPLLLSAALLASAQPAGERVRFETRRAGLNANLLGAAAQARCKRLQWTFGRWGLSGKKKEAQAAFERVSGALSRFREAGESAEPLGDPDAAETAVLRESPKVLAAAEGIPTSAAERVEEVLSLRAAYDPEESRRALERARKVSPEGRRGDYRFAKQNEAMKLLRALQSEIAASAKALGLSSKSGDKAYTAARSAAAADLAGLLEDASFLSTEMGLLDLRYRTQDGGRSP